MWTKAEVSKLTVEQQETLARFELSIARQREQLLKEARGLGWGNRNYLLQTAMVVIASIVFLAVLIFVPTGVRVYLLSALCGLQIINILIQMHTARLNRRLDALLELLDFDHKNQANSNNSKDEKIG